ncbi:nucleic acid/nucleotide deaminase domain-containing protein [Peterkaempfera sp. SMS 1(5)a]|uniref:nucleic acid/nucleotide deaminase domain-containing protein n=1 Tax=Peterkaempfera podocarpi TaxID=3232308 RepID=UPI00366C71F0
MSNPVTHALEEALEKTGKAVGKDGVQAVESLLSDTEKGLTKSAKNHLEHEAEKEAELKAILGGEHTRDELRAKLDSTTPVYHIRPDGVVQRLTKDGPKDLEQADIKRLPLKLDSNNRILPPKVKAGEKPYPLPEKPKSGSRPKVNSQQVPFDHDDLAEATQLARHEDKSYGSYRKNDKTGEYDFQANNYAAARYGKEGDEDGFILVARSQNRGPHSEPALGVPFLEGGSADGLTALYTEREPCSSGPNCSAWMHEHLPDHVQVRHTVEYGDTKDSRDLGNRQMEHHLNALRVPKPHSRYKP